MKIIDQGKAIGSEGLIEHSKSFNMEIGAHAFNVLTDKLYSDKIGAAIRELGSNARDAHRMAGIIDQPFDVHIPTEANPIFYIRDYGPGLSKEGIEEVYTTFFKSTKRGDNSQTGGFGLGAKTPLAYTDSFIVTSYYNGTVYNYLVFKDGGIPKFTLNYEGPTTEPNGLKVEYTVRQKDIFTFDTTIKSIYNTFLPRPNLVNLSKREVSNAWSNFEKLDIFTGVDNWYLGSERYYSFCLIDGVAYPDYTRTIPKGVLVEFPIGALTVTVSREKLDETPANTAIISAEVNRVKEKIDQMITNKSFGNTHKEVYEKVTKLKSLGFGSIIGKVKVDDFTIDLNSYGTEFVYNLTQTASFYKVSFDYHNSKRNDISFTKVKLNTWYGYSSLTFSPIFDDKGSLILAETRNLANSSVVGDEISLVLFEEGDPDFDTFKKLLLTPNAKFTFDSTSVILCFTKDINDLRIIDEVAKKLKIKSYKFSDCFIKGKNISFSKKKKKEKGANYITIGSNNHKFYKGRKAVAIIPHSNFSSMSGKEFNGVTVQNSNSGFLKQYHSLLRDYGYDVVTLNSDDIRSAVKHPNLFVNKADEIHQLLFECALREDKAVDMLLTFCLRKSLLFGISSGTLNILANVTVDSPVIKAINNYKPDNGILHSYYHIDDFATKYLTPLKDKVLQHLYNTNKFIFKSEVSYENIRNRVKLIEHIYSVCGKAEFDRIINLYEDTQADPVLYTLKITFNEKQVKDVIQEFINTFDYKFLINKNKHPEDIVNSDNGNDTLPVTTSDLSIDTITRTQSVVRELVGANILAT